MSILDMTLREILFRSERKKKKEEKEKAKAEILRKREEEELKGKAREFSKPFFEWFESINFDFDQMYKEKVNIVDIWYQFRSYFYELVTQYPEIDWFKSDEVLSYEKTFDGIMNPPSRCTVPSHNCDCVYNHSRERANQIYEEWLNFSNKRGSAIKDDYEYPEMYACCHNYMNANMENIKKTLE